MRKKWISFQFIVLGVFFCSLLGQDAPEPVFVGAKACADCHSGKKMGYQYSKWLLSRHSTAYAVLSKPGSKIIAELSGITEEPQKAAMCLGCHSTGAEAEEWERDDNFRVEDGVQCEKCHGPGSEYMPADVMSDPEAAMAAGLKMPIINDCMVCHIEKGSHVAVHDLPSLDLSEAWVRIAHPTPTKMMEDNQASDPLPVSAHQDLDTFTALPDSNNKYIGSQKCAECHSGPDMSYQHSIWKMSKHAKAFANLSTTAAYETAAKKGILVSPQESPECLKCHATGSGSFAEQAMDSFSQDEGVGCEACHGPGSEYAFEAIMTDATAAKSAGLEMTGPETCINCHIDTETTKFDFSKAWEMIKHPTNPPKRLQTSVAPYKTPLNLAVTPDGSEIWVACESSDSVIVVDALKKKKISEISVKGQPNDLIFSPDGKLVYVTNRLDDSLSVIDRYSKKVIKTVAVGDEPHGLLTDRTGNTLFVLNTSDDSISILDTETMNETRRLQASRSPWSLSLSPDGSTMLVTNTLSRFIPFRTPSMSEVTVVDVDRNVVTNRIIVPAANLLQGITWHPSGEFALITLMRTKNLVPMTRLMQGWTITNGLGIIWKNGEVDQVLLDEPDISFPDPADVEFAAGGKLALVTSSTSSRVAVVDVEKLIEIVTSSSPEKRKNVLPNHLGIPTEFIIGHIDTGDSPRGLVTSPDGKTVYTANALDDTLTVIDVDSLQAVSTIDLGGPREITQIRYGEKLFHNADITFHRQFSCHSCHPDGHIDGLTYDIEPDGVGSSPVDNRTLRGILDTAPFKWEGTNPSLQRQCGPRLSVFFTRIQPFTPEQLTALDRYIASIPRPPNRYRPLGAELTEAQRKGKKVFERTMSNDGKVIPRQDRCITCHSGPLFTAREVHDVGTKMKYDKESKFDIPHLNNIYDSAPYLHNGIAPTLEEIWTTYNPDDRHGVTNDMTKDQLNDLIEYLKTL
jgi:YVTN family beta-propeller protein